MKQFALTSFLTLIMMATYAQSNSDIEMADALRASGKIYVVVLVVFVIFLGLFIYLIRLDRKISKMERELENKS